MIDKNSSILQSLANLNKNNIFGAHKDLHTATSHSHPSEREIKFQEVDKPNPKNAKIEGDRILSTKISGCCPACGANILVENSIKTVD